MKVVALAGGVGGAKLVEGLAAILPPDTLTVVVNTGDDFEHLGLHISPDVDTVLYTLAGVANPETGWGRADETWHFLDRVRDAGGPTWFRLGDKDLAFHLERTRGLADGCALSEVTRRLANSLGVTVPVLPMSDDPVRTRVDTDEGCLPFQEYFVARACRPSVRGFHFDGAAASRPSPGVLPAIESAPVVIMAPSNPFVSLDPILAVPGIREALGGKVVVGVSPIVGGKAIKGPAARMFADLGILPSAEAVARHFEGVVNGIVIDETDRALAPRISRLGLAVRVTGTVMRSADDRRRLAEEVIRFATSLTPEGAG
jgi:LPPG:FO 2-phospho-L-lactate transferase